MAYAPQSQIKTNMFSPPKESQYLPSLNRRQKQNDFVLNCDSSEWKLPEYNSLQDNHLRFFFANPKVRSVLLQTGMIDESGNIHKDTSKINFSRSTKVTAKQKLPPLPEGVNMAVQRIILPYKASRKTKNRLAKASKEQPIPIKRTTSQIPAQLHTQTPPKTIQSMIARGKPLSSIRKVQPLSKDQLAQVFAKYQSNVNKPGAASGTDQSTVASDLTPNKPKQQHCNEYESEFKSSGALNSERKERTLSNEDDKKPVLSPEEPKKEELIPAINEMDDLHLVDPQDMAEQKIEEKAEEKVEENLEEQIDESPEELVEEKAEEKIEEKEEEKAEEEIVEKVEEEVAASPQKVESNVGEDE